MYRDQEIEICTNAQTNCGSRITLRDGTSGKIVNADPESGGIWLLPDGPGHRDKRIWASEVAEIEAAVISKRGGAGTARFPGIVFDKLKEGE